MPARHDSPLEPDTTFQPQYYFFYGTLMDPATLAQTLKQTRNGRPELHHAKIVGWRCKLWGPYPALVAGPPDNVIHGRAYELQSIQERDSLIAYETGVYSLRGCVIEFEDGRLVEGKTFVWGGDGDLLREGTFDLKDWLLDQKECSI
ncbi:hypothetical protein NUU61_003601 [Penicillium alfredii]|uniref:Putative gamma-glutamylcyclotransferase n=1 Tax=Penicillium alfredii TaxID=1506179 RepID=A0A9W9FJJ4_9EURO|nr:uncharacterized protein NUU61_003601 [Penicillium alfredii]KAJ5101379.1 hypothetical protein NUU61_003601 [Penicillium alfredii]